MGEWDIVEEKKSDEWDVIEEGWGMPVSTITGKPVPTPAEEMMMSKRAAAEMLPIMGDIAGTAIAPQLKAIGLAGRGVNLLSRAAGAAAGSVVGETEKQTMTGEYDHNQVMLQGALGAGGEVGLAGLGAGLKAIKNPALELASDLTLSGGKIKQIFTNRLKQQSEKRAAKFIEDIAPESIKGKIDGVGIDAAITETLDEAKVLYNHFKGTLDEVAAKHGGTLPLKNTSASMEGWLNEVKDKFTSEMGVFNQSKAENFIVRELGFSPSSMKGQEHITVRRLLRGEDLSPDEMNFLLSNLFEKKTKDWLSLHPETRGLRVELKEQILKDLDDLGVSAGKRSADEVFKETKRFQAVKNIYDRSMSVNKETGERRFLPHQFVENVKNSERLIRTSMPEVWPKLRDEANHFADVADRLKRGERSLGGPVMLSGLASMYYTSGIPVAEFFGAASAWAMMSTTGRKALEGAFKYAAKPAAKSGLHVGGSMIDLKASH